MWTGGLSGSLEREWQGGWAADGGGRSGEGSSDAQGAMRLARGRSGALAWEAEDKGRGERCRGGGLVAARETGVERRAVLEGTGQQSQMHTERGEV